MKKRSFFKQLFLLSLLFMGDSVQAGFADWWPSAGIFTNVRDSVAARFSSLFSRTPQFIRDNASSVGTSTSFLGGLFTGGLFTWWRKTRNDQVMREEVRRNVEIGNKMQQGKSEVLRNVVENKWKQTHAEKIATLMGLSLTEEFKNRIGEKVTTWYNVARCAEEQQLREQTSQALRNARQEIGQLHGDDVLNSVALSRLRESNVQLQNEKSELENQKNEQAALLREEKVKFLEEQELQAFRIEH